jgi:ribosomal protein S6--L-glutamate ligase
MSGRVLVDPAQYLLGQPTNDNLEELYKTSGESKYRFAYWVLASNPECTATSGLWKRWNASPEMHFLNIKECYMRLDAKTPEIHYRGGIILNQFDAIIPRIRPSIILWLCLNKTVWSVKRYCLNSAAAITQSRDKLYSLQFKLLNSGMILRICQF